MAEAAVELPWDLTQEAAGYITKLSHVSCACRLGIEAEYQLLTGGQVVLDEFSDG